MSGNTLSWSKRPSRRLYYILSLFVAISIWNCAQIGRRHVDDDSQEVKSWDVASWSSVDSPVLKSHGHHRHDHSPQAPEDQGLKDVQPGLQDSKEDSHPDFEKLIHGINSPANGHAASPANMDEPAHGDGETIEKVNSSLDQGPDHEAKLHHADDGDAAGTDPDGPDFGQGEHNRHQSSGRKKSKGGHKADDTKSPPSLLGDDGYSFPAWAECESLKDKADSLPNMVYVPFEDAVKDMTLDGWEDEWIANARFTGPKLSEPKIDFVYNWVNGSQPEFVASMHPYELNSSLNDEAGEWIKSHSTNRYREWNELRYSIRSVEKYAGSFTNRIQLLVNAFQYPSGNDSAPVAYGKQAPHWLRDDQRVQILSQEDFFGPDEKMCLPTFNSLTIENQLYNTPSETDRIFALSDDMILGKPHAASDIYSPLFGPTMGFKDNSYNTLKPPTEEDAIRFGEKPFLIYTSWLLNRRFGARKRKGQVHFGHSLGRSVTREAITSFPRPALRSALQRFRGETGFQLYSWYVIFHYTMERQREALLWSYVMLRSDADGDGYLGWDERRAMLAEITEGMANGKPETFRNRTFYRVAEHLGSAGLESPKVNTEAVWTALDGPATIQNLDCDEFDTEDCLAPGFASPDSSAGGARSPVFSSAAVFDRVARQSPKCGDCLAKLVLNRQRAGLGPLLPDRKKKPAERAVVVKALMRYMYTVVKPDADFYMVTDAEQVNHALLEPYIRSKKKSSGQLCLNDDVVTTDEEELEKLRLAMKEFFDGLLPEPSSFEL